MGKTVTLNKKEMESVSGGHGHHHKSKRGHKHGGGKHGHMEFEYNEHDVRNHRSKHRHPLAEEADDCMFNTILEQLAKHYAVTYDKLSEIVGIAHSHLLELLNDKYPDTHLDIIKKISAVFKISIDQLIGKQKINFKKLPQKLELDFDEE